MKTSQVQILNTSIFRSRLVEVIVNGKAGSWTELVNSSVSDDYRIRIFTDPERRARHVRQYYKMLRKIYIGIPVESLDYAMEAYVLGFIGPTDVLRVAREHHKSIVSEEQMLLDLFD